MELIDIRHVWRQEFDMVMGCQPTNALFFITQGSFSLAFGETRQTVGVGDLAYFPKEMVFTRHVQSPISFYYLRFSGEPEVPLAYGLQALHHKERMENTFRYLLRLCQTAGAEEDIKNHFFRDIFYQCGADALLLNPGGELDGLISYLEQNYQNALSVEEMAQVAGLSKSGLILKFKRTFGITPMQYVIAIRINRAKALLSDTDLPIGEVAMQCGFECPYFFSNSFKKKVGVSPREYRQKNSI